MVSDLTFDDWRAAIVFVGLGLVFLFLEVFIPSGGVLGVLSLGCAAFGVYELFIHGHVVLGFATAIGFAATGILGLRFGLRRLSLSGSLPATSSGPPPERLEALAGKEGLSQTALRPAGVALIEGRRVDVVSQGKFIEANVRVRVVEISENRVVVREDNA